MSLLFSWITAVVCAFLPALFWLIIWYKKDYVQPEPKALVAKAFFFGMLGILPFLAIQFTLQHSPNLTLLWEFFSKKSFILSTVVLTLSLAALEEFIKHFSVLGLGPKLAIYFDQVVDGIIYSVSAALGFAFMENMVYFAHALLFLGITEQFWEIFIFRSFGTMLGHAIFSGIFGFFWGYALFGLQNRKHPLTMKSASDWRNFWQCLQGPLFREHIFSSYPAQRQKEQAKLIHEAFVFAIFSHTIFNLFIVFEVFGKTLTPLVAPLLLVGFLYLSHQFLVKRNIRIWKTS